MKKNVLFLLLMAGSLANCFSQRISFQNFGVDKGLIQSQVQCIAQDKQRHLWVGTFGGLDRFDGTSFSHFTKSSGLSSTGITSVYTAGNGTIWAGHFKGISSYNGFRIVNFSIPGKTGDFIFSRITEDEQGKIWALSPGKDLYRQVDSQFIQMPLPATGMIPVWIGRNSKGQLEAVFNLPGLYQWERQGWQKKMAWSFLQPNEIVLSVLELGQYRYALTNARRLLKIEGERLLSDQTVKANNFGAFALGAGDNIWIGTNKGVFVFRHENLSQFAVYSAATGLSDNFITDIFKDAEENMWIGTDGDGIFRYAGGAFSRYDNRNGLPGNIVMGIAHNGKGQLFIGLREGGLLKYETQKSFFTSIDYSSQSRAGINCMACRNSNDILIGTLDNQLIIYKDNSFRKVIFRDKPILTVNSIVPGEEETWLATSAGCYVIENDTAHKIEGPDEIISAVLPIAGNKTLIGGTGGLYISMKKGKARRIDQPVLQQANITCLYSFDKYILAGTADEGLLWWDRTSGKVYACNSKNGLADDQVFDLFTDADNQLWVGTGTCMQLVNMQVPGTFSVRKFSENEGYERSENNLNAISSDNKGRIWFGTTKGLFIYEKDSFSSRELPPYTVLQKAVSPGIQDDDYKSNAVTPWYRMPLQPEIAYRNNAISFTVKGISLKNPEAVLYSSMLEGYDTGFSAPAPQSYFNYQNLSPGKYTFKVISVGPGGLISENTESYVFYVSRPFNKTAWFLAILIAALIFSGFMAHAAYTRIRQRRLKNQERQRAAEQEKIRQRTAEDFHDELGNKLTRIALLTDILKEKNNQPGMEEDTVIRQIKENVSALYSGTREIIWSLTPGNNNLKEVLCRIEQFGNELFSDTAIGFSIKGINEIADKITLPIDYSRNLNMISKEVLHNSLRHSGCTAVTVAVNLFSEQELLVEYRDNGQGTTISSDKMGNGLHNIQQRAGRIGAALEIISAPAAGMLIRLRLKIPSGGG